MSEKGKLGWFCPYEEDFPVESCHASLKKWRMSSLISTCHLCVRLENIPRTATGKRLSEGHVKPHHNKPFML